MNINFIRRSLPSVWESGRGVEVDELEGGLYMFRFEHQLDVRKVMDKGPWHLNGVLLITHELQPGEFPHYKKTALIVAGRPATKLIK
ncbi:hypothetical protein LINGRAPRIM_LOCUS2079 [Linum grandiflorum]